MDLWTRFRADDEMELLDVDIELGDDLDLEEYLDPCEGEELDARDFEEDEEPLLDS